MEGTFGGGGHLPRGNARVVLALEDIPQDPERACRCRNVNAHHAQQALHAQAIHIEDIVHCSEHPGGATHGHSEVRHGGNLGAVHSVLALNQRRGAHNLCNGSDVSDWSRQQGRPSVKDTFNN